MTILLLTTEDFETFDPFTATDAAIEEMMTDPAYREWADRQEHAARDYYRELHAACEEG